MDTWESWDYLDCVDQDRQQGFGRFCMKQHQSDLDYLLFVLDSMNTVSSLAPQLSVYA